MQKALILSIILLVSACAPASKTMEEAVVQSKENWYAWQKKYWELYNYEPFDPPAQLAQIRYCYKADSDIVCYMRPQPQLTAKLVGYQGPPPNELLAVMQKAEVGAISEDEYSDAFVEGSISVVELEDPTEPVEYYDANMDGQPEAINAPQGLLVQY